MRSSIPIKQRSKSVHSKSKENSTQRTQESPRMQSCNLGFHSVKGIVDEIQDVLEVSKLTPRELPLMVKK